MTEEIYATFQAWILAAFRFLPRLILIAVILIITIYASRWLQLVVQNLSKRTKAPGDIGVLLGRMIRILVLVIGFMLVLNQLGWTQVVVGFITGLGLTGIVLGFALQDVVKQFAAGVLLMMMQPFRTGDYILVNGYAGNVVEIQMRVTVLKTSEGDEVLIPNADVYSTAVTNKSRYDVRRRTVSFKVPDARFDAIRPHVLTAAQSVRGVAPNPAPEVVASGMDKGEIPVELQFWVDTTIGDADEIVNRVIGVLQRTLNDANVADTTRKL